MVSRTLYLLKEIGEREKNNINKKAQKNNEHRETCFELEYSRKIVNSRREGKDKIITSKEADRSETSEGENENDEAQ